MNEPGFCVKTIEIERTHSERGKRWTNDNGAPQTQQHKFQLTTV